MRSTLKKLKGGRQKQEFLMKDWCFGVERAEMVSQVDLMKDNSQLQEMVIELHQKVSDQASFIKKMQSSRDNPAVARGRKRSLEEYSDRHQRRLKKERSNDCHMSLFWLEKEGYVLTKVNRSFI